MTEKSKDLFFVLPKFDVPQKEASDMTRCTYEDAVRDFEALAKALKLREQPRREDVPVERFEL